MAGKVISRFQSGSGIHLISSTFYGTCDTAANNEVKQVEINDEHVTELKLIPGMLLSVKFTNGNTAADPPQLEILDSSDNVLKNAVSITPNTLTWGAGEVILFVYNKDNNNNEQWISNYLSISGGTLTGKLDIQNNDMDITTTPSSTQYNGIFEILDSNDKQIMNITAIHNTNNYHGFSMGVYDPDTGQQNTLQLMQNNNDNYGVWISQPAAWRSALGIGTIGTKDTLTASDIPNLAASKITSGTLGIARGGTGATTAADAWDALGGGDIGKKDSLAAADIPNLAASKITSGILTLARGGTASDNTARAINTVFAGPSSGDAGNASWRKLVAADIPSLNTSKLTAGTLGIARGGTGSSTVVSILANTTRTVLAWGPLVVVQLHGATGTPGASTVINTGTLASYTPAYNASTIVADINGHIARLWVNAENGNIGLAAVNYTSSSAWYGTLVYMRDL